jgi:PhnB protein
MPKPIPDGYHSVTPSLTVRDAERAIAFYRRAFGAEERMRLASADGSKVAHAELKIGDSIVMLSDEFPEMGFRSPEAIGGTPGSLFLYVDDVDRVFARAVEAGGAVQLPVQDMFWGDRFGRIADPFGHVWGIATHKEDLTPDQIRERAARAGQG